MSAHQSVLPAETIEFLAPASGQVFVDATCGAGGHTALLAAAVGAEGSVIALDQDDAALAVAQRRLAQVSQIQFVCANFRDLREILDSLGIEKVHGILADLGTSSMQLTGDDRGFSFRSEGELDMRMDERNATTAARLLKTSSEEELGRIFREYGEERHWRAMARAVVRYRETGEPFTGPALQALAHRVARTGRAGGIDSATRIFQALRIAVNDELGALSEFLPAAENSLLEGGRLAVISFHSLEDRLVKHHFRAAARGCVCPKELPRCVCGHRATLRELTRKPITPSEEECRVNPRARSAKLRVAQRLG